ncbi:ABC1 kinase family protein [Natronobacterium gregoryi]|uniref:ABC-1 domain-containing protein n=2 Tax=Natronobacterium gregoryi TaxID=44930 RepID=L0ADJ8_NATGS|nr:AarF/UbiB family protein [Natronobacterium gregoryi]AFZ71931.1 putative unusual protein kinase [Natronobacterium gregoryi SP2]ELY62573.1 ABC-1 domain-containing protein [Natronobacterium gregoryi SP2]PLK20710.1 AarF/ABC1/UbiB kinase family protein [Natronobacterium gregoryi SP2]SFJ13590.1 Predicted unusual protein kinase regulating ubiquinone biosynthesis, AarF/ABC1/UbiB family [Natronobacterium gregoryi]
MKGYYLRYLQVLVRFLPVAIALLRDRRRFLLFGPPRQAPPAVHHQRARRLTETMLDLGPAFIKVGQVLSTRPDIVPPIYVEEFATLQDEVPEDVGGDPMTVVEEELGNDPAVDLETLERVAGGSLAFVYTVEFDAGDERERIALKVRRPGLVSVIERDLRVIRGLVPLLSTFADERQRYSLRNLADDFEEIILEELDFEREASVMAEIGDNFVDNDRIVIPETYDDRCSERLIAMEFVEGRKITEDDALEAAGTDSTEIATLIARTYLQMGLVDGVFHADPHPGNLAVSDDGQLIIYDYGMSQRLTRQEQDEIVDLYRTLVQRDVDGLLNSLIALEVLEPDVDRVAIRRVLELVIENLEGESDVTWRLILTELLSMLHDFPFRIPPNVMLLMRVGTVGEGVCRSLDPEFDFISVTQTFLVEHGFIENELESLLGEVKTDVRRSAPVLAGLPARADAVMGQLERGELVVRTDPVESPSAGDPGVGYAVITAGLLVATGVFTFHAQPYEFVSLVAAALSFLQYVRVRRAATTR